MAELFRSRFVNSNETEQGFENLLHKSPGAKLFFNLPPRRQAAGTLSEPALSESDSKLCRNGRLLSPVSKILKQMHRHSVNSAVKGNVASKNGYSSPMMPPPRTTFVYRGKGDTPDEPRVILTKLHHAEFQRSDSPAALNKDTEGGNNEEVREVELENDEITEENESVEQQETTDDGGAKHETGKVTKQGKNDRSRLKKFLQEKDIESSQDHEQDTRSDALKEEISERMIGSLQKRKNYRDTPPNVDMNDIIEETVMDQWYLTQPRKRIIVIEGHRVGDPEGELWHSSAVSKRLSPRLLVTTSGSRYRVKGPINIEMTLEHGFSAELVKKFLKGFPADWKEIIQEQSLQSEELDSQKDKLSSESTSKGKPKHAICQEAKESSRKRTLKQDRVGKTTPVTTAKKKSKEKTTQGDPKSLTEIKSTPSNAGSQMSSTAFKTPHNPAPVLLAVDDLHRSRSGRRILPPLAYWTGERIRPNYRLDQVEIIEGSPDYTSLFSNPRKLVGLKSDKEISISMKSNLQKHRKRKHADKMSGSSKPEIHKTKDGSVAKQPKRRTQVRRIKTDQCFAKNEKAKDKERNSMGKSERSMQEKRKANSAVCYVETKSQTDRQKGKKHEEEDDGKGQSDVETEDDEETETLYWSRKSTRRPLRREKNLYSISDRQKHDGLKEKKSEEIIERRVTRSQTSKHNSKKKVNGNVKRNLLSKECADRGKKIKKNDRKQQRTVTTHPLKDDEVSPAEIGDSPEQIQISDTESTKQDKEMQRTAKQDTNKQRDGSASFDLFGDILGILAKQREKRQDRSSLDGQSSSRFKNTSSEASSAEVDDNEVDEISATNNSRELTATIRNKKEGDTICDSKVERACKRKTGRTWIIQKKKTSVKDKSLVGSFQESPEAWSSHIQIQPIEGVQQSAEHKDSGTIPSRLERSEKGSTLPQGDEEATTIETAASKTKDRARKIKTGRGTGRNGKTKKLAEKENNQDGDEWSVDEMERLQRAMRNIKPSTNNFWEKIAEEVGTRDKEECCLQHQSSIVEKAVPGPEKNPAKVTTKVPVTINAKKGTLKRKRQLRELAEHHNMGFEEDLFDATPYREGKKSKILLCDSSDEENSEAQVSSKTPSLMMPNVVPFSTKKTPHANWTPGLLQSVNRNKAEEYIFRMQKRKNLVKQKSTPLATRPLAKTGANKSKFQSRFNDREVQEAFDVEEITEEEDSEGEKDYYWSEEEDAIKA